MELFCQDQQQQAEEENARLDTFGGMLDMRGADFI